VSGFFATTNDISSNSITVNNTLVRCNVKPTLTIGQHRVLAFSSNNNNIYFLTFSTSFLSLRRTWIRLNSFFDVECHHFNDSFFCVDQYLVE
jgi:hypothetical protein